METEKRQRWYQNWFSRMPKKQRVIFQGSNVGSSVFSNLGVQWYHKTPLGLLNAKGTVHRSEMNSQPQIPHRTFQGCWWRPPLVFISISIAIIDHQEQMQPGKERTYFSLQFYSMVLHWVKLGQELGGKNWWGHHGGTLITSFFLWLVQPIVPRTIYLPRGYPPTPSPTPKLLLAMIIITATGKKTKMVAIIHHNYG